MLPINVRHTTLPAVAVILLSVVAGLAVWPQLPAEMAIHFDGASDPNGYVSKTVGVFLAPAIGIGAILFSRAAVSADSTTDPQTAARSILFVGLVIAYVQGLVLAWNLGMRFDMTTAIVPVLVGAGILVAYERGIGRTLLGS
jgi:uncharacterized membrane protein